jgi:hypothetical protein
MFKLKLKRKILDEQLVEHSAKCWPLKFVNNISIFINIIIYE